MSFASESRKFLTAAVAAAGVAVTEGLVSSHDEKWISGAIAIVGAILTYFIPNSTPTAPLTTEGQSVSDSTTV